MCIITDSDIPEVLDIITNTVKVEDSLNEDLYCHTCQTKYKNKKSKDQHMRKKHGKKKSKPSLTKDEKEDTIITSYLVVKDIAHEENQRQNGNDNTKDINEQPQNDSDGENGKEVQIVNNDITTPQNEKEDFVIQDKQIEMSEEELIDIGKVSDGFRYEIWSLIHSDVILNYVLTFYFR